MSYRGNPQRFRPSSFVHSDYDTSYKELARQIREETSSHVPRGRGRGKSSGGRKDYQETRVQAHRMRKSKITQDDLSEELKKKLLPGVKDGTTAAERLESYALSRTVSVPVTTRGIGFATANVFKLFSQTIKTTVPRGNIYAFYRVALALLNGKMVYVRRASTRALTNSDDYSNFRMSEDDVKTVKSLIAVPDQIASIIAALGTITVHDKTYEPRFVRDRYIENRLIPMSESVRFDNLRQVVLALADRLTPAVHRRRFRENNPIPGTIWIGTEDDPILQNADEIMPADYDDLADEVDDFTALMEVMNRKMPKYFRAPPSFSVEGKKDLFVCNEQNRMHVVERREGEQLTDYYDRIKIQGNIEEFWSIETVSPGEQVDGGLVLLGEAPVSIAFKYPEYILRDIRSSGSLIQLSYKAASSMKYA